MKKWLSTTLFYLFLFQCHTILAQSSKNIWETIHKDTFPYLFQFENIEQTAKTTLRELNEYYNKESEDYSTVLKTAFTFQVLASHWDEADSLILASQKNIPAITNELKAIKLFLDYLSCAQNNETSSCKAKKKTIVQYLRTNTVSASSNENMKWYWINKMLEDTIAIQRKNELFEPIQTLPSSLNPPQYSGAILATQRTPQSTNLLISNGYRQNVQLLELNKKNQWIDVTSNAQLDSIPGGHRLYAIDINNDGYQDIIIIRKNIQLQKEYLYPSVLINQKNGKYIDISHSAGFNVPQRANCVCFLDANKDNKLDIFIGNEGYNSLLFIQEDSLKFKESANTYGIVTGSNNIVDCWTTDMNQDNQDDLLLSAYKSNNYAYIFEKINGKYPFFINQAQNTNMTYPYSSGHFIVGDFDGNLTQNIIANTHLSPENKDEIFNMLAGKYTPSEYPLMWTLDTIQSQQQPKQQFPLLTYERASINIDNGEAQPSILFGGGADWDEYYPLILYQFQNNQFQSQKLLLKNQPISINSMAVTPQFKTQQPIIWMKGGGDFPTLKNSISSYLQSTHGGKFYQTIIEGRQRKDALGAKIIVTTQDLEGQQTQRMRVIQATDSQGKGAGQNIWFVPKNSKITKIEIIWPDKSTKTINKIKGKNQIIKIKQ